MRQDITLSDRLYQAALRISEDAGEFDPAPVAMVWLLTEEAAETARSFAGPPRSGYPAGSAWPEFREDDFFAVERERLSDGVEGEAIRVRVVPSRAAVSRYDAMRELWNGVALSKYGAKATLRNALWRYAEGCPPRFIHRRLGVSRQRLHAAKTRACEDIANFLGWST